MCLDDRSKSGGLPPNNHVTPPDCGIIQASQMNMLHHYRYTLAQRMLLQPAISAALAYGYPLTTSPTLFLLPITSERLIPVCTTCH